VWFFGGSLLAGVRRLGGVGPAPPDGDDDGSNDVQQKQQTYSTISATAVREPAPNPAPDYCIDSILLSTDKSVLPITVNPESICDSLPGEDPVGPGICYSRSAASEITKLEKDAPFVELGSEAGQIDYNNRCKSVVPVLQNILPAANNLN